MSQTEASPGIGVRHVEAGRGFAWWSESFAWLFGSLSHLGIWVAMGLCVMVASIVLDHLATLVLGQRWFAGSVAVTLLWFVLVGGAMAAAHKTAQGLPVRFGDFFAGFGTNAGPLLGVGLVVVAACAALVVLSYVVGVGATLAGLSIDWSRPELTTGAIEALLAIGGSLTLLLLIGLAMLVPLSLAVWLAPALIVLRSAPPLQALRLSLSACWRSLGALTLYSVSFFFLAAAATTLLFLGWFFLLPLMLLSTYSAYRDLFEAAGQDLDAQAPPQP
jgi:hypothetical protein